MYNFIFSININKKEVFLANRNFYNLFTGIEEVPFKYEKDEELSSLISDAFESLKQNPICRISFEKDNILYSFDIDKMDDETVIFSGKKFNIEEQLKSEHIHNLLRLLSDNLPDMLWAKDLQGRYIFTNRAICKNLLMAKNTEEPVGKTDVFFALRERKKYKDIKDWHTFGELCFNSDEVVIENMQAMRFEEYGNLKGKLTYLEVHKAPFFDQDGRLLGTVGSGRDITKEVLSKKTLKEKEELLLQQSKMAAIGEMLQNIAHQWRHPLSSISSISTGMVVQKQLGVLEDDYLIESLNSINKSTQYLSETIDNFRDFFKPQKSKSSFDIKGLEDKLFTILDSRIKHKNIKVISTLSNIKIIGFENELLQVLINIFNNAIDVMVEREISQRVIVISSKIDNDSLNITIQDNGGGIKKEIIEKIFDSYFTTKNKEEGTGIGLYMSNEIITKHMNGTLLVENKKIEYAEKGYIGAEFKITLPINN